MAALGWLLNLDFAASPAEAPITPIDNNNSLVVIYDVPHIIDSEIYEAVLQSYNAIQALNDAAKETLDTLKVLSVETASFTVDSLDGTMLLKGNAAVVQATLPDAADYKGRSFRFKAIDITNACSVISAGGDKLEGVLTAYTLTLYETITVQSDGVDWWIVSN